MSILPQDARGTKAEKAQAYEDFARLLLDLDQGLDFRMAKRDWCYWLEEGGYGLTKTEFDRAERAIDECRLRNLLPVDFALEDDVRRPYGTDGAECDGPLDAWMDDIWEEVSLKTDWYNCVPWADYQTCYVEVLVEKIGLRSLLEKVCDEYQTLVMNGRGDSDFITRARMMLRFQAAVNRGQTPVLLYAGDFDPKGVMISDNLVANLRKMDGLTFRDGTQVDFDTDLLVFERFALNYDFIVDQLPQSVWTDNLLTGSGKDLADPKHTDHLKYGIPSWIRKYGERKCEANAIVTRPEAGRQLFRDTLDKYLDHKGIADYWRDIDAGRVDLKVKLPPFLQTKLAA